MWAFGGVNQRNINLSLPLSLFLSLVSSKAKINVYNILQAMALLLEEVGFREMNLSDLTQRSIYQHGASRLGHEAGVSEFPQ